MRRAVRQKSIEKREQAKLLQAAYKFYCAPGRTERAGRCADALADHFGISVTGQRKRAAVCEHLANLGFKGKRRPRVTVARPRPKHNVRDDFYSGWDWKRLRYEAIKAYGRRCMCCGFTPSEGSKNYIVVDHIKPRRQHPELELDLSNLQILCNDCNMGKSNVYTDDFRDRGNHAVH